MHDTTYNGLFCWSNKMFEKFGWMTLAHRDKDNEHIKNYVSNIEYLISHIDNKIENLVKLKKSDSSMNFKIEELKILKNNVSVLLSHAKKWLKNKL